MGKNTALILAYCEARGISPNVKFTDVKGKFFKCHVTLPGHEDCSAQGGGTTREVAQEKASDELIQYLQVSGGDCRVQWEGGCSAGVAPGLLVVSGSTLRK